MFSSMTTPNTTAAAPPLRPPTTSSLFPPASPLFPATSTASTTPSASAMFSTAAAPTTTPSPATATSTSTATAEPLPGDAEGGDLPPPMSQRVCRQLSANVAFRDPRAFAPMPPHAVVGSMRVPSSPGRAMSAASLSPAAAASASPAPGNTPLRLMVPRNLLAVDADNNLLYTVKNCAIYVSSMSNLEVSKSIPITPSLMPLVVLKISLSKNGKYLAIVGEAHIIVVEIPNEVFFPVDVLASPPKIGQLDIARVLHNYTASPGPNKRTSYIIKQAEWHPHCEAILGVLTQEGFFMVWNTEFDHAAKYQHVPSSSPQAFAWGRGHLWGQFSVWFCGPEGQLSFMCPVFVPGQVISQELFKELKDSVPADFPEIAEVEEHSCSPNYTLNWYGKARQNHLERFGKLEGTCSLLFLEQSFGAYLVCGSKAGIVRVYAVNLQEVSPLVDRHVTCRQVLEIDLQFPQFCSRLDSFHSAMHMNTFSDLPNKVFFHHSSGLHVAHLDVFTQSDEALPSEQLVHKLICTTPLGDKSCVLSPLIGLAVVNTKLVGTCAIALTFDGEIKVVDLSVNQATSALASITPDRCEPISILPPPPQYCFPRSQKTMPKREADLFIQTASEQLKPTIDYLNDVIPHIQEKRASLKQTMMQQEERVKEIQQQLREAQQTYRQLEVLRNKVRKTQVEQRARLIKLLNLVLTPPFTEPSVIKYLEQLRAMETRLDDLREQADKVIAEREQLIPLECTAPLSHAETETIRATLQEPQEQIKQTLETVLELRKRLIQNPPQVTNKDSHNHN
ncbi:nuclear pore complex protein Nup88 [Pelomyxa schiedti]|nr:nuclear pore complex protein Nup88 [Pelomyxa schiedti]